MLGQQSIAPKAKRRRKEGEFEDQLTISRVGDEDAEIEEISTNGHAGPSSKNVDDLLPIGVSLFSPGIFDNSTYHFLCQRLPAPPPPRRQFKAAVHKEWAHVVDVNQRLTNVSQARTHALQLFANSLSC